MVHLIFAAMLLGQAQDPSRAIDAAFADLDRRYFAMLGSNGDALVAALGEGPSDVGSQTSRCLGLLTPSTATWTQRLFVAKWRYLPPWCRTLGLRFSNWREGQLKPRLPVFGSAYVCWKCRKRNV